METQQEKDTPFNKISSFIKLRQKQKLLLQNKNTQINDDTEQLIHVLLEELNEGHTVLSLKKVDKQTFKQWQNSELTHVFTEKESEIAIDEIDKPIIIQQYKEKIIIWLHRQWYAELRLARQLLQIANRKETSLQLNHLNINQITVAQANIQQQQAINNACQNALTIITGGPGTGKTFTVAQLVIILQQNHYQQQQQNPHLPPLSIALTAPTGKAAQRMQESLQQNLQGQPIKLDDAKTLHRLLGIGKEGIPRYHQNNPLPDDLVIVDEASMLGLELAGLLVDAIKPTGRLILLGDANQLSAVDAGSVLADLCCIPALKAYRVELLQSQRFNETSEIGQLAQTVKLSMDNQQEKEQKFVKVWQLLSQAKNKDVSFYQISSDVNYQEIYQQLIKPYLPFFEQTKICLNQLMSDEVNQEDYQNLFKEFDKYRILSAGHHGKLGIQTINRIIAEQHQQMLKTQLKQGFFYHGQPILIKNNDYYLGVFNGDIGICLQTKDGFKIGFPDKILDISRLSIENCDFAYALTIHKSQGSEFTKVAVCVDESHHRLLSQELVYTAITRSKQKLDIYSTKDALRMAVLQKRERETGLDLLFS